MKVTDILAGIAIFQKYGLADYDLSAEHDQIIVEITGKPIYMTDLELLHNMGWFQPYVKKGDYRVDEYWVANV